MTRSGTHQVQAILSCIMKTLLPSTEYSRIGIARDIMKHPRNDNPRDLSQAIAWLEDFFNRYVAAVSVRAMMEPKEALGLPFVHAIVKQCYANDVHEKLDTLLREWVVKLRMRRNNARVDTALGVSDQQHNRPGARSLEALSLIHISEPTRPRLI
eukprot:4511593-Amphidinium_carterae.1